MGGKKSIFTLTFIKLIATGSAVIYSIIQVHYFGTKEDIEVFFASSSLLYLILSLSQSGQLAEVFLPEYLRLKTSHGKETAQQAFSVVANWVFVFSLIACIVGFLSTPYLIKAFVPGFSEEAKTMATLMFRTLIFVLIFQMISSFIFVLLNAEKIYGRTEAIGLINGVVSIGILIGFYKYFGIWCLVISLYLGKVLQMILYAVLLKRMNFTYYPIFKADHFDHRIFFKTLMATSLYVSSIQFYNFILTASISILPQGIYAVFKYTETIFVKSRGIVITPITTIFFTEFAEVNKFKMQERQKVLIKYLAYSIMIGLLTSSLVISFGEPILAVLWADDYFEPPMIKLAYHFLVLNYLGLIAISVGGIFRKAVVSSGHTNTLYTLWSIGAILAAGMAYMLIDNYQTDGLKWSILTTVIILQSISVAIYNLKHREYRNVFDWKEISKQLLVVSIVTSLGYYLSSNVTLSEYTLVARVTTGLEIIGLIILTLFLYSILSYWLKIKEYNIMLYSVRNRIILFMKSRI